MPWRATPDRILAFERCTKFWEGHGYTVVCGDSDLGPFNRSQARNRAVAATDASVVIVSDADTLPSEIRQIEHAIDLAADSIVVWPYDYYRLLPAEAVTSRDLASVEPIREYPIDWRPTSITAISRATYDLVGGYDERFGSGWGYEDSAFASACRTFAETVTLAGIIYAFDHQAKRRRDPHNKRRHAMYKKVEGDPAAMRNLTVSS